MGYVGYNIAKGIKHAVIVDGVLSVPRIFLSLGRPILITLVASTVITFLYQRFTSTFSWLDISSLPLTVLGAALSIFLAFRNNTVYDRWWEARTLWGALINQSRTFARQVVTFGVHSSEPGDKEQMEAWQKRAVLRHIAFVHAFRHHLRGTDPWGPLGIDSLVPASEQEDYRAAVNVPVAIMHRQGQDLHDAWQRGWIKEFNLNALDATLSEFMNIQGGCERIKNTPLPPVYTYLAYRLVVTYCCLVPLGLVKSVHVFTPVVSLMVGFAFLVLDRIAALLETPFGTRVNDLSLTAMSRTIEIDLRQRIKASPVPEPIAPVDGILL